ncbi:hypothetical protein [Tabrizicola sp.]|uniref:hypothetical protein n=1 Tax=Tabrizicola sp. TaxID=2005166 RepID=UPI00286ABF0C|nr:hypothetical protein [Tabrizicola sp.]
MTTIITRLYANTAAAQAAVADLMGRGHGEDYIDIISREGDGTVRDRMLAARVSSAAAAAYAAPVSNGNALVVVRAPFNPVGAARNAMRALDRHPSIKVGLDSEDEYIREQPRVEVRGSILMNHPLFMSHDMAARERGTVSSAFGVRTLSPQKTKTSAISGGGFMSTKLLPFALLSRSKEKSSVIKDGWQLSTALGIPTISRR